MLKFSRILIIGSLFFLIMFGCAGSKKQVDSEQPPEKGVKMDESFDPLQLEDDEVLFPDEPEEKNNESPMLLPEDKEEEIIENKLTDGFRVQIISTKNLENASQAKQIAIEQFEDYRAKFYLEFDSPYYKVRLGDYLTRQDAERMRDIVRARGYPKAWIVKSKVWSNPEIPVSTDSTNHNLEEYEF